MPIQDAVWAARYPELLSLWADEPAAPKGNLIRRNVCQGGTWDGVRDDARAYVDLSGNLVADDVGLAGSPPQSFDLREDSPAWNLGFEAIPEQRIGPRPPVVDRTIRDRTAASAWQEVHEPLAPRVGDMAPDFELSDAVGQNPVRLSSFSGRPVALVFGSFT